MAYDVSLLNEYVNEQNFPLLKKSIFGAKTASIFNTQAGIKHSSTLNFLDVDAIFQDNTAGSPIETAGNAKFSQRIITVSPLAVRMDFDPRILNEKYLQSQLKAGSSDDEVAFEAEIVDELVKEVTKELEVALWQGDVTLTGASNVNKNKFDGYIKVIDAEADVVKVTGATISSANIMAQVDKIYEAIPVEILDADNLAIYMGKDMYRIYTQALKNANMFHYTVDGGDEFTVPGTTTKVISLNGLNGTGRIFAGKMDNFVVGVDLNGEEDSVTSNYSFDTEKVKMKVAFKIGVQVAFPSEIVTYKVA